MHGLDAMLGPQVEPVVSSTVFSGSYDLEHHGAICQTTSVRTPLATTASFAGVERAYGRRWFFFSALLLLGLARGEVPVMLALRVSLASPKPPQRQSVGQYPAG